MRPLSALPARGARAALAACAAVAALLAACAQPIVLAKDDSAIVLARQTLTAPDPAARGPLAVRTLTYGSGTDRRRAAFRDSVAIRTASVDASPFAAMEPAMAKSRKAYWGFDNKAFPVNGRVWYPDGPGPYPLVLVVHGNHDMKDFSDPGYGYLGEHLASRGFILASVDENFLNGALRNENDARGWMLLEHLKAWRRFADSSGSPLHGKVDMRNIALMGHSRGGEAVAVAAAFNRLSRYPDDATVTFDYGFDIKGLVAIAPVDGQYRPAGQGTPLENVSYLVLHGSHDGDVSSYNGLRQWDRVRFPDGGSWFKSAIWMYRANHGQWNTVWGNKDNGRFSGRNLELRALIAPEAQRQMALVFVSGFLEATLKGRREYVPLFRDHRSAGGWLPKAMYQTAYADAGVRPLTDFERTIDVTRGALPAVRLQAESLSTWREAELPMRWRDNTYRMWGVWLGWNNAPRAAPRRTGADSAAARAATAAAPAARAPDTTARAAPRRAPATLEVSLPDSLRSAWSVGRQSAVVLTLVPTRDVPGPRKTARDSARRDSTRRDSTARAATRRGSSPLARVASAGRAVVRRIPGFRPSPRPTPPDTTPLDLTVELVDAAGRTAPLPLANYGPVRRPLEIRLLRRAKRDQENYRTTYELVPQTFVLPVADFASATPGFDPTTVRAIRLRFDRTEKGTVVLTSLGIGAAAP
jgi:dienelactone hydrolase